MTNTEALQTERKVEMEKTPEVTDEQIKALRDEAGAAGDSEQVVICDRALYGDDAARDECASVIAEAQAQAQS